MVLFLLRLDGATEEGGVSKYREAIPVPVDGAAQKPKPVKMFRAGRHPRHHRHPIHAPMSRRQWSLFWRINELLFELGFGYSVEGGKGG